jgi:hypothetical protein
VSFDETNTSRYRRKCGHYVWGLSLKDLQADVGEGGDNSQDTE